MSLHVYDPKVVKKMKPSFKSVAWLLEIREISKMVKNVGSSPPAPPLSFAPIFMKEVHSAESNE